MGSLNIKTSRSRHQNNFLNFSLKPPLERNKGTNDELQPTFSHSKCTRGKRLKEPPPPALKPGPVQEKPHGASFFRPTCRSNLVVYRVLFAIRPFPFRFAVEGFIDLRDLNSIIITRKIFACHCQGKFNQHNGRRFRRCVYDLNNPPEMSAQDRGSAKRRERRTDGPASNRKVRGRSVQGSGS